MKINIVPINCYPATATQLRVDDCLVTLGVGLNAQWALLDSNDVIVAGPGRASLTDEQYAAWTGDDAFVVESIASNLTPPVAPSE